MQHHPVPSTGLNSALKLRIIVALFALIFFCFLTLDYFRIQSLAAIQAYVRGEGLWSKAQKESVIALRRYGRSHDPKDYQPYLSAIAVPLGDNAARLELEKRHPDYQVVYRGFLQGGIHPEDVPGMASLFRRFRKVRYMSDAIDTWTLGDQYIAQLQANAEALHAAIDSGRANPEFVEAQIRRIDDIDNVLTPLENRFSDQMALGSHMLAFYLSLLVYGIAGLLLSAAVLFSLHLAGEIQKSELALDVATETLKRSERRFRSLIQDLSDVILVLGAGGSVHYASHSAERIFGYAPADLAEQSVFGMIHPDDQSNVRIALEKAASQQAGAFVTEFRFRRKDGSWIELETTGNQISDDSSGNGIVLTCRDITERRRLERELGQSQKMEAVGRLAGGIAHDFNNILMVIGGYVDVILDRLHPEDPLRETAEPILRIVDRGAALTKRLLSFSRKQVITPRYLDINQILEEMGKVLPRLLGEEIEVVLRTDRDAGLIHADHTQFEQVVLNLAVNSRDAMPHGGKLTIETASVDFDQNRPSIQPFIVPGSYVVLSVTDTGCGMNPETKNRIFEPFFTTKEEGKGTGLGLSTVFGIVKRSGGYILVDSEPDAGTCVRVYFPRVEAAPSVAEPFKSPPVTTSESGVVLIVEDEQLLRRMISEYLKRMGFTVLEAAGGTEARAVAEKLGHPIDLLVTDVILPRIRGPELARQFLEQWPELKVIYISGFTGNSLVRDGVLEPDTILLQKPFRLQELSGAIRQALSKVKA